MPCIGGKTFVFLSVKPVELNLCQYFKWLEMKNDQWNVYSTALKMFSFGFFLTGKSVLLKLVNQWGGVKQWWISAKYASNR